MQTYLDIPIVLPTNGDCAMCIVRLKNSLSGVKGVNSVEVASDRSRVEIDYDPDLVSLDRIEKEAKEAGVGLARRYNHDHLGISGLDCADCALTVEKAISRLEGVVWASVNFASSKMSIEYEAGRINRSEIAAVVKRLGYGVKEEAESTLGAPKRSTFYIPEMDCDEEIFFIKKKLGLLDGVEDIEFNLVSKKATITHRLNEGAVVRALREIKMTPQTEEVKGREASFLGRNLKLLLTLASGATTGLGFVLSLAGFPQVVTIPLYIAAIVTGGWFVARKGFYALMNRLLDMNFLMTVAAVGATAIGEWTEGAMVMFLFSLANLLESFSMDRARSAIRSLMALSPNTATVRQDGREINLPVEEIRLGDTIVVKPGERLPLDGVVVEGNSSINQAPITGESMPVEKKVGDDVFAGTINGGGYLEVSVTKPSQDTMLSRIIHLVEEAQSQKAPAQNFVDRFAKYYTPAVIGVALLLALVPPLLTGGGWTIWFYRGLVLLVVSCPCALVISTPVTIVAGLAKAARNGILIKGGVHLEGAGSLKAIAFDKTGTLTKGRPEVTDVIPLGSASEGDVLRAAASIEARSEHHLAQAVLSHAQKEGIRAEGATDFQSITGKGASARLSGENYFIGNHRLFEELGLCTPEADAKLQALEAGGKTAILLGNGEGMLGIIGVADGVREEATASLRDLKRMGIERSLMLTGDNRMTAKAIADRVGVDEYQAELLPQDKVEAVKDLIKRYGRVAMVGDGVNDAPALAAATVGIAMGASGTDAALETADIALVGDDLSKLPLTIRISRKALRIVKQNIAFSLIIKALFVALTPFGFTSLWMAVGADMGASLLVIFNGLRTLKKMKS
jgi:Cd2+/Zn2+-exporting ATPase